ACNPRTESGISASIAATSVSHAKRGLHSVFTLPRMREYDYEQEHGRPTSATPALHNSSTPILPHSIRHWSLVTHHSLSESNPPCRACRNRITAISSESLSSILFSPLKRP